MRGFRGAAGGAALALLWAVQARAGDLLGQPTPGGIDLQPAAAPLKHQAIDFHNFILMPIITAIAILILALLGICIVRFNSRANPTPARWSHNTTIEMIWTAGPVLILTVIAIFSFKLLFAYSAMPPPDLTVKATGYQWYWGYAYPDQKIDEYTSNYLDQAAAKAAGEPYLLGADNPMVVPVNKNVRVLVTGADVIHDFGVPAFGLKMDAVPGRVNATWFRAEKIGTYYGQCDQLCGVNHAFMPIEIRVVSQKDFDAWVAGKTHPAAAAASASSAPASSAPPSSAPASSAPAAAPPQKVARAGQTALR
ncbi:MAG TPA: cytochrome c oxidase subunit II [Caulobacteraceae bacterium]|nr:cytochrome c oxidase subunit II [Caulobacteraceae bacterium]